MSHTKAVHLKNYKKYVLTRGGEDCWRRILARLSPEERDQLQKTIVITAWIDCDFWWRLLNLMDQTLGKGDRRVIHDFGFFDAQENLSGVYKMLFSAIKTEALIKLSPLIWRLYYDTGQMQVAAAHPRGGEIRLAGFPNLPPGHEVEIIGWLEGALDLMRLKQVRVVHSGPCLAKGDAYCSYRGEWA